MFIETKIWISDYGYDATLLAFDKSARKLAVDQLDLLILHQPLPSAFDRTLGAYRALEKLLADELSSSQQNFLNYFVDGNTSVMDELCGVPGA